MPQTICIYIKDLSFIDATHKSKGKGLASRDIGSISLIAFVQVLLVSELFVYFV